MAPHIAVGGPDQHGSFIAFLLPSTASNEPHRTVRTVRWMDDVDALCKEWGIPAERVIGDGLLHLRYQSEV